MFNYCAVPEIRPWPALQHLKHIMMLSSLLYLRLVVDQQIEVVEFGL